MPAKTTNGNTLINKQMPLTRRRILTLLKEKGKLTADELSADLGISAVAVRRHLTKLEQDRLVAYESVQRGMGRPSFVYELGDAAENFFPRGYEQLALMVLDTVEELYGVEAVEAVFKVRAEHLLQSYRPRVNGETLDKRLDQIAKVRQADGYMTTWQAESDGSFIFKEANCPIMHAAENHDCVCGHDIIMLSELLDADLERQSHLKKGDSTCSYRVKERLMIQ